MLSQHYLVSQPHQLIQLSSTLQCHLSGILIHSQLVIDLLNYSWVYKLFQPVIDVFRLSLYVLFQVLPLLRLLLPLLSQELLRVLLVIQILSPWELAIEAV